MTSMFLGALFLVGAAVGGGWWLLRRRERRVETVLSTNDSVAAHLVMNLGMAVMTTPLYTGGIRGALIGIVGALGAYFALRLATRSRAADLRARRSADAYHLVAAAAMAVAIVLMPAGMVEMAGMSGAGTGGHADMRTGADGVAGLVGWVLAALFALDAVGTAVLVALAPSRVTATVSGGACGGSDRRPVERPRRERLDLRVAAVPHVIMDVGMVWMLLPA